MKKMIDASSQNLNNALILQCKLYTEYQYKCEFKIFSFENFSKYWILIYFEDTRSAGVIIISGMA